jgi:acetyl esterase/lipase
MLLTMASQYLQGSDPRSPYASPIYADLTGLPPTLVQAASNEALFDDAERLVAMLRSGGTAAEFEHYEDSFHVFQNIAGLPETAQALSSIASFVQSHTRPAVTAPAPSTK